MGMIGNAPYGGVIGTGNILNSAITADKLSSTAIQDKLGFIPQSANDVATAVANLVSSAPSTLNTLDELAAALGDDANFATTIANSLGTKLTKSNNLSDLMDIAVARTNLGLGNVENKSSTTIRGEITSLNVTTALGFTPVNKAGDSIIGILAAKTLETTGFGNSNYAASKVMLQQETDAIARMYLCGPTPSEYGQLEVYSAGSTGLPIKAFTANAGGLWTKYLSVEPQNGGTVEGGELALLGAGSNQSVILDNFSGSLRVHGGSGVKLVVNTSGHVTMPNQPSFHVIFAGGGSDTYNQSPIKYTTIVENNAGWYNSKTGRFTAQTAGRYFFSAGAHQNSPAGVITIRLWVAGGQISNAWNNNPSDTGSSNTAFISGIRYMNVGDTAEVTFYTNKSSNYMAETYWYFNGFLIG